MFLTRTHGLLQQFALVLGYAKSLSSTLSVTPNCMTCRSYRFPPRYDPGCVSMGGIDSRLSPCLRSILCSPPPSRQRLSRCHPPLRNGVCKPVARVHRRVTGSAAVAAVSIEAVIVPLSDPPLQQPVLLSSIVIHPIPGRILRVFHQPSWS